jgi:hypothetical protein
MSNLKTNLPLQSIIELETDGGVRRINAAQRRKSSHLEWLSTAYETEHAFLSVHSEALRHIC